MPTEYKATRSITLDQDFESGVSDAFIAYIVEDAGEPSDVAPDSYYSGVESKYRYGFNSHEKSDEIEGEGNHTNALFGEYDTRIGRRWDLDPKPTPGVSQYSLLSNNPVWHYDVLLDTPTVKEAALMSKLVYGEKLSEGHKKEFDKSGWKLSNAVQGVKFNNEKSGLKSALFERTIDGKTEYTLAFAGTEDIIKDGSADLKQIIGASNQYDQGLKNARDVTNSLRGAELTFTGHSLGGGLANASALYTDKASITFNPAWVSNATLIRYRLVSKPQNVLNNYVIFGEVLDVVQRATNTRPVPQLNPLQNVGKIHYLRSIESYIPLYGPISNHMIDNVIEEVEDVNEYNVIKDGQ